MNRLLRISAPLLAVLLAAGASVTALKQSMDASAAPLRIAVIADRSGGHRPGVFEAAMGKLDLMQPDIVLSVGDLIEGYVEDEAELDRQWDEVAQSIARFDSRFYAVPGNHDIANAVQARIWEERRGATYWSHIQDGVLIIGLSTEDPPIALPPEAVAGHMRLQQAMARDAEATQQRILETYAARGDVVKPGSVAISDAQVEFVRGVLADNPNPRWTLILMHKPAWNYDSPQFVEIAALLADRPFTAIAGHEHYYAYRNRNARDYLTLSTTGGVWLKDGPGRVDHILWITIGEGAPNFANIEVDGIFPKEGRKTSAE